MYNNTWECERLSYQYFLLWNFCIKCKIWPVYFHLLSSHLKQTGPDCSLVQQLLFAEKNKSSMKKNKFSLYVLSPLEEGHGPLIEQTYITLHCKDALDLINKDEITQWF